MVITALGLWLSGAAPIAAQAPPTEVLQPACQTHDEIMRMLNQEFAEVPAALGLHSNGQLLQMLASRDGTTWTIVPTRPDGVSCSRGSGSALGGRAGSGARAAGLSGEAAPSA